MAQNAVYRNLPVDTLDPRSSTATVTGHTGDQQQSNDGDG